LRIYELCLIFHNDTSDEQLDQMVQSIGAIIARHGGSVLKTEKWLKKNFKYMIKKQSKGHYCFVVFEAQTAVLAEIERSIMYNESILRFNFIRLEKFIAASAESDAAETQPGGGGAEAAETQPGGTQAAETVAAAEPADAAHE